MEGGTENWVLSCMEKGREEGWGKAKKQRCFGPSQFFGSYVTESGFPYRRKKKGKGSGGMGRGPGGVGDILI